MKTNSGPDDANFKNIVSKSELRYINLLLLTQLRSDFGEPFLLPGSVQMLQKIDFMNTIVAFKDLFGLSVVLCKMHLRHDDTIRWCLTLMRLSVKPWRSLQIKLLTSTMLAAVRADHGWRLSNAVFQYIAAVDFVQQFVQTSSAKQVMLNSL